MAKIVVSADGELVPPIISSTSLVRVQFDMFGVHIYSGKNHIHVEHKDIRNMVYQLCYNYFRSDESLIKLLLFLRTFQRESYTSAN